jgi:hypothetical protein
VAKVKAAESLERLREWLKPGDTLYTVLDSVSRSGMSRTIRVVLPYVRGVEVESAAPGGKPTDYVRKDSVGVDFLHPNHAVAEVLGYRRAKRGDGLIVGGCGMDMGFHVVNSLSSALYGYLRCENPKCKRSHPSQHTRYDLTARPTCEDCGEALSGGYQCLGPGKCPSNYHVNHRDRVHCEGTRVHNPDGPDFGERCYRPGGVFSNYDVPDGWPRRQIDIGDGETVDAGPLACIGDLEAGTLQVCPTCQGAGDVPNPDGPERWDLLHTDGYAIRHRWL